jgi:hypothetical protein
MKQTLVPLLQGCRVLHWLDLLPWTVLSTMLASC